MGSNIRHKGCCKHTPASRQPGQSCWVVVVVVVWMQVRELDNRFYEACSTTALLSLEKYGLDGADLDALPEEARTLLQDKDTLLNAVQVSALPAASQMAILKQSVDVLGTKHGPGQ